MATKFMLFVWIALLFVALFPGTALKSEASVQISVGINTGDFGFLGSYGSWVSVSGYGQVWRPRVYSGWRPFSVGQWAWTDQGWTWISAEPYGWAVYHYGNWVWTPNYGWVWIPGYDYSPARVQFTYYGDYVGWAPLAPAGVVVGDPWIAGHYWSTVRVRDFARPSVRTYFVTRPVAPARTIQIIRNAPEVVQVEKASNRKVEVVHVNTTEVTGGSHKFKKIEIEHAQATGNPPAKQAEAKKAKGKTKEKHKPEKP